MLRIRTSLWSNTYTPTHPHTYTTTCLHTLTLTHQHTYTPTMGQTEPDYPTEYGFIKQERLRKKSSGHIIPFGDSQDIISFHCDLSNPTV